MRTSRALGAAVAVLLLTVAVACSAPAPPAFTLRTMPPVAQSASASATPASGFSYSAAEATITAQDYTIAGGPEPAGSPGPLRAFKVICTGSADGACGTIIFFYGNRYVDSVSVFVTGKTSGGYLIYASDAAIAAQSGQQVVVRYRERKPSDAMCCPSGPTFTVTYRWNRGSVVASGQSATKAPPLSTRPS